MTNSSFLITPSARFLRFRSAILAVLAVTLAFFSPGAAAAGSGQEKMDIFLKTECPSTGYVGQPLPYELFLYASVEDVADIKTLSRTGFGSLNVVRGQTDSSRPEKVKVKGRNYWRWNVARDFISSENSGNVLISGGTFCVYIPRPVVVNDFFFGAMRSVEYERVNVSAPDVRVKFKDIPGNVAERGLPVGDFSVIAWLPPGEISKGHDAVAIVKISGEGFLKNYEIPDLSSMFSGDCRLKNIDRRDNMTQQKGKLTSEILLECHFVPTAEKGEIGEFSFSFFDPSSGKVKTVRTEPQPWNNEDEYTPVDKSKLVPHEI